MIEQESIGIKMRINLQNARKEKGLTQQQVAGQTGISLRYYKQIESGQRTGGFEIWDSLEDLFNVHQRVLREMHHDKEGNP